jgi:predicted glycosyltransferase
MSDNDGVSQAELVPPYKSTPRILFYAVNGLGLGHVTRLLAIAHSVRARCPDAQILFLTTSDADWVIYRAGFAAIKVPSRSILPTAKIKPAVYNKLVQSVVMNAVSAFNPAILVADTFPAGASQELLPTLTWDMRRAFVFRAQKPERANDAFFQAALTHYDICIAPHEEGTETIPVPPTVKAVFTGPIIIRSAGDAHDRATARRLLGLPQDVPLAYISFGGGGDSEASQAAAIAIEGARQAAWEVAVAEPPLSLAASPKSGADVYSVRHYPMAEMLPAFDAAVSAAGYNTVAELMHFGIPSILLPFERGFDDQFARVSRLVDSGAALTSELNAEAIGHALSRIANPSTAQRLTANSQSQFRVNGAEIAAQAILSLL